MDAHHVFPHEFHVEFMGIGINVNDPAFGVWKDSFTHRRDAYEYNQKWRKFWDPPVDHSKEGAFRHLEDLDSGDYNLIKKRIENTDLWPF